MKAIINGKEITVFGKDAIQSLFTEKVQELISQGMRFSFTDSGHQGEVAKCDLTCGDKTVYRVLCDESRYSFGNEFYQRFSTTIVKVIKYENVEECNTLWNDRGETVFEKVFFNLSNFTYANCEAFVDDVNVAIEIRNVQNERSRLRWEMEKESEEMPESWNRKVLKIVRNKKGYKTVHLEDIKFVTKEFRSGNFIGWRVCFEGSKSDLWIKAIA